MKLLFFLLIATFCCPFYILAQGEIEEDPNSFFNHESSWGLYLTSTGYGINYHFAKRLNATKRKLITGEIFVVKHPKEVAMTNPIYGGGRYIFGKTNFCLAFRGGLGKQIVLFSKQDKGSVAVKYAYSYGGSVAFLKPVYYEVEPPGGVIEDKLFREIRNDQWIIGRSSAFKGFSESSFVPGVFVKGSVSFEYSTNNRYVSAIEGGVIIDAYMKELDLMAETDNSQFFFTLFIAYRFGKIINDNYEDEI